MQNMVVVLYTGREHLDGPFCRRARRTVRRPYSDWHIEGGKIFVIELPVGREVVRGP